MDGLYYGIDWPYDRISWSDDLPSRAGTGMTKNGGSPEGSDTVPVAETRFEEFLQVLEFLIAEAGSAGITIRLPDDTRPLEAEENGQDESKSVYKEHHVTSIEQARQLLAQPSKKRTIPDQLRKILANRSATRPVTCFVFTDGEDGPAGANQLSGELSDVLSEAAAGGHQVKVEFVKVGDSALGSGPDPTAQAEEPDSNP